MAVQERQYFCFSVDAWEVPIKEIPLTKNNAGELLEILKGGGNLFSVVPGISRNIARYPFFNGFFAKRDEIVQGDKGFYSSEGFEKIGRLLVPHYNVRQRDEIEGNAILEKYPDAQAFYMSQIKGIYSPLDIGEVLVLGEKQIGH